MLSLSNYLLFYCLYLMLIKFLYVNYIMVYFKAQCHLFCVNSHYILTNQPTNQPQLISVL